MKMTKENYKEIIDEMCKIDTSIDNYGLEEYYYHHSFLNQNEIEIYAFEKGILINNVIECGCIRKVTFRKKI